MSAKNAEKPDTVTRCVPRQDGGYLVITRKGRHGVSLKEVHIGASVRVEEGRIIQ